MASQKMMGPSYASVVGHRRSTSSGNSLDMSALRMSDIIARTPSALGCPEMLSSSPSTSSENIDVVGNSPDDTSVIIRRRTSRGVLCPLPSIPTRQQPQTSSRSLYQAKRASLDLKLNQPQHQSVQTRPVDRGVHHNAVAFKNLLRAEEHLGINSHYFEAIQTDLTERARQTAIDWLSDVSKDSHADAGVLPLSTLIFDRFLSCQGIYKKDLQGLAATCYFLVSKIKESTPISARKMSSYTADTVSVGQILSWEMLICQQLGWDLALPTAVDFYDHVCALYPSLGALRDVFIETVHKLQQSYKLALLLPSLQTCLALLAAATTRRSPTLIAEARTAIAEMFNVDLALLEPYLTHIHVYCQGKRPKYGRKAPPSTSEQRATPEVIPSTQSTHTDVEKLVACRHSLPATPLNDSGFSSTVCSPDGSHRSAGPPLPEIDSDCSPPKMRRLSVE